MKRKLFLAGMLVVVLAITILSCGANPGENLFRGTWIDTLNSDLVLIFTASTWETQDSGIRTGSGRYTFSGKEAELEAKVELLFIKWADAKIDGGTLILTDILFEMEQTFTKK